MKTLFAGLGALLPFVMFAVHAFADREIVVQVFGQEVRENRLMNPADPKMTRGEVLAKIVRVMAFKNYAKENGLEPTEQEIESGLKNMPNQPQPTVDGLRAVSGEIDQNLATAGVPSDKRQEAIAEFRITAPDLQNRIRRHFVSEMILNWKVGKHLHQKFGGQIVLSPIGYHFPIDAYAQYLHDSFAKDKIRIEERDLKEQFLAATKQIEPNSKVVSGQEGFEIAFSKAPWL